MPTKGARMQQPEDQAVAFTREASLGMPGSIKQVADFLLAEGTGIEQLSMAQIATRAYTSKPTLVRFAKQAGYAGWKDYRHDFLVAMRRLEAMLICADRDNLMLVSGTGEVIEPDDGILAIGSGGNYALAAARALYGNTDLPAEQIARKALEIASDICVYTNANIIVEEV
jgi:ATP-dependent protease HslVU peptidase subunit